MLPTVSDRAAEPDPLRAAELLCPVQIWVPDTRRSGFADECRRQSAMVAAADRADRDLMNFMDAALGDMGRPIKCDER